ncbi:MAG TPA: hypothetical protein VH280_12330, partial [Verrucomicrobiae bacterium]|nr:hypothetical protein [Verrucomicrobiae bacterium]
GLHDLVCPMQPIEDLGRAWGQPNIWRLPHSHHSFMFNPGLTNRILEWLSPRLAGSEPHGYRQTGGPKRVCDR